MQLPEWTELLRMKRRLMILARKICYYAGTEFIGLFALRTE